MDLRALIVALLAALAGTASAQTEAVRKFGATDRLIEDLRVPSANSLIIESGGSFSIGGNFSGAPTGGFLNLSNVSVVLPPSSIGSSQIVNGSILDADISVSAAISVGKLSVNPTLRSNHTGTQLLSTISDAGTLAGLNAVGSAQITDGSVANGDLAGSIAAIKLIGTDITTVGTIANGTWQGSIIAPAYLGTGSSITTKFLRGDGTWQTVSGTGDVTLAGDNAFTGTNTYSVSLTPLSGVTGTDEGYHGEFQFGTSNSFFSTIFEATDPVRSVSNSVTTTQNGASLRSVSTHETFGNFGTAITVVPTSIDLYSEQTHPIMVSLLSGDSLASEFRLHEPGSKINAQSHFSSFRAQAQPDYIYYVLPATIGSVGDFFRISAVDGTEATLSLSNNGSTLTSLNASNISSGTLAVARGGTGLSSLGSGVATFLGTPSFSNLNAALTGDDVPGLAAHQTFTGDNRFIRSVGTCVTITQNNGEYGTALLVSAPGEAFGGFALRVSTDNSGLEVTKDSIGMSVGSTWLSLTEAGFFAVGTLTIGQESEGTGQIQMNGITSGMVTIKPADAAGEYVLTLPTNDGDANQFLQTNGSGVLSFAAALTSAAIDTSAEVAAIVGDETGSGALVFATSPTLTTPNLGTPSAITLTNATGLPIGGITMNTARLLGRTTGSAGAAEEITVGSGLSLSGGSLTATGGAGTKTIAVFAPLQNQPPAANFATIDTRNSIAVLNFDAATDESAVFVGVIPEAAVLTSGIKVRLFVAMASATSGSVDFGAQFERTGTDLDSDSFDTATEAHVTVSGTSGIETVIEITCTNLDSLTAGDAYRLKLYRDADDGTNDTATGDAQLVRVEVRTAN